jgi:hypothetical protein
MGTGNDKIDGAIRHTLTFLGGMATTFGVASTMQVQEVQNTIGQVSTAAGILASAAGLLWSIFSKPKQ